MPHQLGNNGENGRRRRKNKWPGEPLFVLLFGSPGGNDAPALSQPVNCELRLRGRTGMGGGGLKVLTASKNKERSRAVKRVRGRAERRCPLRRIPLVG